MDYARKHKNKVSKRDLSIRKKHSVNEENGCVGIPDARECCKKSHGTRL